MSTESPTNRRDGAPSAPPDAEDPIDAHAARLMARFRELRRGKSLDLLQMDSLFRLIAEEMEAQAPTQVALPPPSTDVCACVKSECGETTRRMKELANCHWCRWEGLHDTRARRCHHPVQQWRPYVVIEGEVQKKGVSTGYCAEWNPDGLCGHYAPTVLTKALRLVSIRRPVAPPIDNGGR